MAHNPYNVQHRVMLTDYTIIHLTGMKYDEYTASCGKAIITECKKIDNTDHPVCVSATALRLWRAEKRWFVKGNGTVSAHEQKTKRY